LGKRVVVVLDGSEFAQAAVPVAAEAGGSAARRPPDLEHANTRTSNRIFNARAPYLPGGRPLPAR
jgi:hypothetical protein